MWIRSILLVAALTLSFAMPALTQSDREQTLSACQNQRQQARQQIILSCTQIINSPNEINEVRSLAYYHRSESQRALRKFDEALADINEAIRLNRNWAEARYLRGLVRLDMGNRYRALDDFSDAIQVNPRFATAWLHRAVLRRSWGDQVGATADYNEALRLDAAIERSPLAAQYRRTVPEVRQASPQPVAPYVNQPADTFAPRTPRQPPPQQPPIEAGRARPEVQICVTPTGAAPCLALPPRRRREP